MLAQSILAAAFMVLSARAAGVERPPPTEGWERVGCAEVNRQTEFTFGNPPLTYEDCWTRCGRYSNFSALGDNYCWCGLESLSTITVVPASEDKCEAFCLANAPDTGGCGAVVEGTKYYDVYKKSEPGVTVIKRQGSLGTPTKLPGITTPTPSSVCGNCTKVITNGTQPMPSGTPTPCTGSDCTVITSSGSVYDVAIWTALAVLLVVFSIV